MFSKTDFQTWGNDNAVLFAAVMTKIKDRRDDELLREYGFRGFPSLAVLDADGEAITKNIGRSLQGMATAVSSAKVFAELQPKVEAGETVDQGKWFLARLGLGKLKASEAKEELASLKLDDGAAKQAAAMIFTMELAALQPQLRSDPQGVATKALEFYKAGQRLPEKSELQPFYDAMVAEGARAKNDGEAFLWAYPRLRKGMEERLAQIEAGLPKADERMRPRYEKMLESTKQGIAKLDEQAESFEKAAKDQGDK